MYIGKNLPYIRDRCPEKIALYTGKEAMTYREFVAGVERYRAQLRRYGAEGVRRKVALFIGNEPAFLQMFFAIISLGWVAVPIDSRWSKREAERVMDEVRPDFVVASRRFNKFFINRFSVTFFVEDVPLDIGEAMDVGPYCVSEDALFYLGFTSGSTGVPKGFYRDHRSWLASFSAGESVFGHGEKDVFMAPGPLCYSLSLYAAVYALHSGATFYLFPHFSKKDILAAIRREESCFMYAVPTMLQALALGEETIQVPVTFVSSGSKLQPAVRENIVAMFPACTIYEYYGASELSFVTYMDGTSLAENPDSVGRPFPGVELSIRNERHEVLGPGEVGELYVASPYVFREYMDAAETREVVTEYGVSVGDVGYLNDAGYLFIVGRKKNMIISGGQNVYPEEIEKVLLALPSVKELAVLGIPHDYWGEQIVAMLSWKEGEGDSLRSLRLYSREHLAIYKRPQRWIVVESFPYTATGKIDRQLLMKKIKEDKE